MKLQRGQNLFKALRDVCDFTALESDMDELVKAVEADNSIIESKNVKNLSDQREFLLKYQEFINREFESTAWEKNPNEVVDWYINNYI